MKHYNKGRKLSKNIMYKRVNVFNFNRVFLLLKCLKKSITYQVFIILDSDITVVYLYQKRDSRRNIIGLF